MNVNEKIEAHELSKKYISELEQRKQKLKKSFPKDVYLFFSYNYQDSFVFKSFLAYLKKENALPSKYIKAHMPWLKEFVSEKHLPIIYFFADNIKAFGYSNSISKRSFRSESYLSYAHRIASMIKDFHFESCVDAPLIDSLSGNLPAEIKAYNSINFFKTSYNHWQIAFSLNSEEKEIEEEIKRIVLEENGNGKFNYDIIRGILYSNRKDFHVLLGKLLLASRLQEGLRQSICECADLGTKEGFLEILTVIHENNLIRYSSVKRAVGTWTGILAEESRDLERVSEKNVSYIIQCIDNDEKKEEFLSSEDALKIHTALWAYGTSSIETAVLKIYDIIKGGTKHQLLCAGYFTKNLCLYNVEINSLKHVLKSHNDKDDVMALWLSCLSEYRYYILSSDTKEEAKIFFNRTDIDDFFNVLKTIYQNFSGKAKVFSPCVFPWHEAKLSKSILAECLCLIAALAEDNEKTDYICSLIKETENGLREDFFIRLLSTPKTELQRKTVLSGLADKGTYTRKAAFEIASKMTLSQEEYLFIEAHLKFKNSDIKTKVTELLLKQKNTELKNCISRLIESTNEELRSSALDILLSLKKDEKRKNIIDGFHSQILSIFENGSEKEKLITKNLLPQTKVENHVYEEYVPTETNEEYAKKCIQTFMRYFPDSSLETLLFSKKAEKASLLSKIKGVFSDGQCASVKEAAADIDSFLKHFEDNKTLEMKHENGDASLLGTVLEFGNFSSLKRDFLGEFLKSWVEKNNITHERILRAYVYLNAKSQKTEFIKNTSEYIPFVFGKGFEKEKTISFYSIHYVFESLVNTIPRKDLSELGDAISYWFIKQIDEKNVLVETDCKIENVPNKAHLLSNSQLYSIFKNANTFKDNFIFSFPLTVSACQKCSNAAKDIPSDIEIKSRRYYTFCDFNRETKLLSPINEDDFSPKSLPIKTADYIFALYYGIISKEQCFNKLLKIPQSFETISVSKKYVTENGINAPSMKHYYNPDRIFMDFIGKTNDFDEKDLEIINLASKLYDEIIPVVIDGEIRRGEAKTQYTRYLEEIVCLYGVDNFAKLLFALGNEKLSRNYYFSYDSSRKGCISYLLSICSPTAEDNAEKLGKALCGKISNQRLIEAALYSPDWIKIIGEYLHIPSFESLCYYFIAHTSETHQNKMLPIISKYTPLSPAELNDGAFDVSWFKEAYSAVSLKEFNMIYESAKYISDGAKHMRARKYADAASGKYTVSETEKEISEKRNKDLLMAYSLIPIQDENDIFRRYLFLQKFKKESKQFGSQRMTSESKATDVAISNLSINAGYSDSMRLILRMEMKTAEENKELFEEITISDITLKLFVDVDGKADISVSKGGKPLKSIPSTIKKNEKVIKLQGFKKLLKEQYSRTKLMLEEAMENQTEFNFKEISELSAHPVVSVLIKNLVFISKSGEAGFISQNGLIDSDGNAVSLCDDTPIFIAHPYTLFQLNIWRNYQKYLFDNQIKQPIRQVFRELYIKTPEETESFDTQRYAGNQIQVSKTVSVLKNRRWTPSNEGGIQKVYYKENIVAEIYALADWFSPADIENPTVEQVLFTHRKTGEGIKIKDIPPIIFSEVMRDVDLAVSVAHAGGVDPEATHSTVDMRKAIISFILPMLKISNVELKERNAYVKGSLGEYSVNLGSGVVHQLGGTMIPVLPVHSQHKGKIFLPFTDDDPKTAEILSKIILFAEDTKIKDPSILSWIQK